MKHLAYQLALVLGLRTLAFKLRFGLGENDESMWNRLPAPEDVELGCILALAKVCWLIRTDVIPSFACTKREMVAEWKGVLVFSVLAVIVVTVLAIA